jgi:hypothetical protein
MKNKMNNFKEMYISPQNQNTRIECYKPPTSAQISAYPKQNGQPRFPKTDDYNIQTECRGASNFGCAFGHCLVDGSTFDSFWTSVITKLVNEISDLDLSVAACTAAMGSVSVLACGVAGSELGPADVAVAITCATLAAVLCRSSANLGQYIAGEINGTTNSSWRGSDLFKEMMARDGCAGVGGNRSTYEGYKHTSEIEVAKAQLRKIFQKYGESATKEGFNKYMFGVKNKKRELHHNYTKEKYSATGKCAQGSWRHPVYLIWRGIASTIVETVSAFPGILTGAGCAAGWTVVSISVAAAIEASTAGFGTPAVAFFAANDVAIGAVLCLALEKARSNNMHKWGTDGWKQEVYDELCSASFV